MTTTFKFEPSARWTPPRHAALYWREAKAAGMTLRAYWAAQYVSALMQCGSAKGATRYYL